MHWSFLDCVASPDDQYCPAHKHSRSAWSADLILIWRNSQKFHLLSNFLCMSQYLPVGILIVWILTLFCLFTNILLYGTSNMLRMSSVGIGGWTWRSWDGTISNYFRGRELLLGVYFTQWSWKSANVYWIASTECWECFKVTFLEIMRVDSQSTQSLQQLRKNTVSSASSPKRRPNNVLDSLDIGPHLDILLVLLYQLHWKGASFE